MHSCACCDERFPREELTLDSNGDFVCHPCEDEYYKPCENCDELFKMEYMNKDDYSDWYCDPCKSEGHGEWYDTNKIAFEDISFERRHR